MEVWLQESKKVNKQRGNHLRIVMMSIIISTTQLGVNGQALCFSPFFSHSSPEVSFLKPERGDGEIEVCLVGVEVVVATLVELENPMCIYVCVCTIVACTTQCSSYIHAVGR